MYSPWCQRRARVGRRVPWHTIGAKPSGSRVPKGAKHAMLREGASRQTAGLKAQVGLKGQFHARRGLHPGRLPSWPQGPARTPKSLAPEAPSRWYGSAKQLAPDACRADALGNRPPSQLLVNPARKVSGRERSSGRWSCGYCMPDRPRERAQANAPDRKDMRQALAKCTFLPEGFCERALGRARGSQVRGTLCTLEEARTPTPCDRNTCRTHVDT